MITNFAIFCGLACGALGRKLDCVFMWSVLLHTLLAIYLSVMLSPTLAGFFPALNDRNWLVLAMAAAAAILFVGVSMLSFKLLSSALNYQLPSLWDQCGAALCAFVAGFLAVNFVFFLFAVAPGTNSLSKTPDEAAASLHRHASAKHIATTCHLVSSLSLQGNPGSHPVIDWLLENESASEQVEPSSPDESETDQSP